MFEDTLTATVVALLNNWFRSVGLWPTEDFDPLDPACIRDHSYHRIWTASAVVPPPWVNTLNMGFLEVSLSRFLDDHNQLSDCDAWVHLYEITAYQGPRATTLYASIYQ